MTRSLWPRCARLLAAGILAALGASALTGCSTILLVRNPQARVFTDPVYESSKPFFFLGLVGPDYDIYVDQVCLGKEADQVSTEYTLGNALTGLLTLGIYTPRTLKIWCTL